MSRSVREIVSNLNLPPTDAGSNSEYTMSLKDKKKNMNYHLTQLFCLSLGLLLTLGGVIVGLCWSRLFDYILADQMRLTPTSESFRIWQKTPIPLYLDFYMFNWTNPEDIKDPNVVPHVVQLGPYRFKEDKEKANIVWNDNGTVTFQQKRFWYFMPEESNGTLEDEVTTVNAVAATAVYQTRHWSYILQKGVSLSLSAMVRKIEITRTVGELLFDGYPDKLIDMARSFPAMDGVFIPPLNRFGWFYGRNGSTLEDGVFNMETGENDSTKFGVLQRWNYGARTKFFSGHCGMVNGSAGEFWPINRQKDSIDLFSSDLCRSIKFDYNTNKTVFGIDGYTFSGGNSIMDNGTLYPENKCFCNGDCVPSGTVNVSSCRYGAPAFVSFPHFYKADPYYRRNVAGMQPDPSKHSFDITLEPKTGIPLDVAARFQINILLQESAHVSLYQDVRKTFLPVLWFEQRAQISGEMATDLHQLLQVPIIGLYVNLAVAILGFGILTVLAGTRIQNCLVKRRTNEVIQRWGQGGTHTPLKQQEILRSDDRNQEPITTVVYTA